MASSSRKAASAPASARKTAPAKTAARAKPAPRPAKASQPAAAPPGKTAKVKKPKLVRDSFTMPKDEYAVVADLKLRAAKLAKPAKKSELLRAGIKALAGMSDALFLSALAAVPAIKTGRPRKT